MLVLICIVDKFGYATLLRGDFSFGERLFFTCMSDFLFWVSDLKSALMDRYIILNYTFLPYIFISLNVVDIIYIELNVLFYRLF